MRRLLKYLKPYKLLLFISFISALLYVSSTLYTPIVSGDIIDKLNNEGHIYFSNIKYEIIRLIIVIAVGAIFGYIMNYFMSKACYKIVRDIRIEAFKKLDTLPVSYIDKNPHGDILSRLISDIDAVSDGLLQTFTELTTGVITIAVTLVFMFKMNYKMALIVVLLTPLSLIGATLISKLSYKTFKGQAEAKGKLTGFVNEMVESSKVVASFNLEDDNMKTFNDLDEVLYKYGAKAQFASSLANPTTRFVNAIMYMAVATIGALEIVGEKSSLTVGMLSAFLTYASQYTKPFNSISGVATELQNSFASLRRVYEILDEKSLPNEDNKLDFKDINGDITFSNVSFSYNKDKKLIKDFSLEAKRGQMIALVGPTGCGKTTLINLLMRFYDIDDGTITIDSKNIYDYKRSSLRNEIGMVLQDTWLFKGSVFDNIKYGMDNATSEQVVDAAKRAYAHDFIMKLPKGYDTIVSDSDGISQGQKQLLCIARLMLRIPNVLILDEATSNIDTRTEIMVSKAFRNMMEGRTSFIIAHRLSTIKNADKIVVLKDGCIVETGTHDDLLAKNGFYAEIYNSQFKIQE